MNIEYKKKLLLVPSAYNLKALGDVINFVEFYKDDLDINILVRGIKDDVIKFDNYNLVNVDSSYGKFLRITSDFVIDAGSMNNTHKKGLRQKYVSIWHGIPYKRIMRDEPNMIPSVLTKYINAYDIMISSSPYYTNTFLKGAMMYDGQIKELGCSRMDSLFNKSEEDIRNLKIKLGIDPNKKVILYAPTYREAGKIDINFDINRLNDTFFEEYVFVVKLHYLNELHKKNKKIVDLTSYENISDILLCADLLISDYSSVVFDFSVLKKPILLYQYDRDGYVKDRGLYFDICDYIENDAVVSNQDELLNKIMSIDFSKCNHQFKNHFYPYEDGSSTERIVKALNFDVSKRKFKDIIFLINQLNEIGGIHTFVNNMSKYYKTKYNARIFVLAVKEFATWNTDVHFSNFEYADFTISGEYQKGACALILKNSDSYIISTQFWAHTHFQKSIHQGNSIVMFHDDPQLLIDAIKFPNHLKSMNSLRVQHYRRYLMLTKLSEEKIRPYLIEQVRDSLGHIRNSIDLKFTELPKVNHNSWAFVGRLDDQKNPLEIIKIGKKIKDNNQSIVLNVYGDGPLKNKMLNCISENGLEKIVILHGYVSDKEHIYRNNKGLILVSKHEGFGLVILEAYSFGRPVIVYDTFTAASEVVENNVTGFLVNENDYDGIYNIITNDININVNDIERKLNEFNNDNVFEDWNKIFNSFYDYDIVRKKKRKIKQKHIKFIKSLHPKKVVNRLIKKANSTILLDYTIQKKRKDNLKKVETYEKNSVSFIVPCYNGSKYLKRLISSIIKQGLSDYEIIIVDDGSNLLDAEKTKKIAKQFYNENINVVVYEKENSGPGLSRNYGIHKCTKEYVFFIDVDDILPDNSILNLLVNITENSAEVVSGVTERRTADESVIGYNKSELWYPHLYKKSYVSSDILERNEIYKDTLSTNKLYLRSVFEKYDLYFEPGLYEDKVFTSKLYSRVKTISFVNEVVYYWMVYGANKSITTSKSLNNFKARMEALEKSWPNYNDYVRISMISHFIKHDLRIYLREFREYSEKEKKIIFEISQKFLNLNRQYIYVPMLINDNISKYILNSILNNQAYSFFSMGDYISEKYYSSFLEQDYN